jgi:hypothetical protein
MVRGAVAGASSKQRSTIYALTYVDRKIRLLCKLKYCEKCILSKMDKLIIIMNFNPESWASLKGAQV